jgi:ribosomal protein S18 acetylase RimI-like enzyme
VVSLGLRTHVMVLELGGSEVTHREGYVVVRTPENPGYWWGNFIALEGAPAAGSVSHWLATFAAEHPAAPHRAFSVDSSDGALAGEADVVAAGLSVERSTVMVATSVHPPPRPNTEVSCRRLESDDDWEQALALELTLDAEEEPDGHRAFVEARMGTHRRVAQSGHGGWFGAFASGRLVSGMGLFTDGSGLARFQAVATHPDFRRQGLAGTLVHHVGRYGLGELGATALVMVADPDDVAIRVYRSVGFHDAETQLELFRPPPPG